MKRHLALVFILLSVLLVFGACGPKTPVQYNLVVQVQGQGTVYPSSGSYDANQIVYFQLNPQSGWSFSHWEGRDAQQVINNNGRYELYINKDTSLTAVFTASAENKYNLEVIVQGRGLVNQKLLTDVDPQAEYPANGNILLTAQPESGWLFKEWLGDVTGTAPIVQVRMDRNKRVTAVFEQPLQNLTVTVIGKGVVEERLVSEVELLGEYPKNTLVKLIAKPDNGWLFKEWQGDFQGKDPVANIELDCNKNITAVFVQEYKSLDITIQGKGSVEKRLMSDSEEYPSDSTVRLWAKADEGWEFKEWRGDVRDKNPIIFVKMDYDQKITAIFEQSGFTIEIDIIGEGQVDERLISGTIAEVYPIDSLVRLTAKPARGWLFSEWHGDVKGSQSTVEIKMNDNKYVTAVFIDEQSARFKVNVDVTGNGQVKKDPDSKDYAYGTKVTLTASPDSGWRFVEWLGDLTGKNREVTITMDSNKDIEAIFTKIPTSGTGEVSGSVKLTHMWPNPYNQSNNLSTPKENIGKIPVLHNLGVKSENAEREEYVKGELIVGFDGIRLMGEENQISVLEAAGLVCTRSLPDLNAHIVKAPEGEAEMKEEMARISNLSGVSYVEPNYLYYVSSIANNNNIKIPNDPMYSQQWHYNQIRLPHAWSVTTGSNSVRVAVLDTGIDHTHEDMKGKVDTSVAWNFNGKNSNTMDGHGHGTHCAGTIGAATNNGLGVAGILWDCALLPIKVMSDGGSGSSADIADGILYAAGLLSSKPISNPAHIISMSIGGGGSETQKNACDAAVRKGLVVFAASGNNNGPISSPANYASVIAVGSTNLNYPNAPQRAWYSNFGAGLDFVIPGGDTKVDTDGDGNPDGVLSTAEKTYKYYQGTSMACPHAAGVGGLLLANGIPASQVREVMRRTAMDIGGGDFSNQFGYGLVNVYWAVNNVKEIKIVVGLKNGNSIDAVAEGKIDLRTKQYSLSKIPAGEYQVFGWIDVQNTGTIDSGDYLFESAPMIFSDGQKLTCNLELKEVQ